jgi:hypothetical protein
MACCEERNSPASTQIVLARAFLVILSREDGEGPYNFPASQGYLCDQMSQCEVPRFPRDDKPVLGYQHEKFLARETGTIVVFVVGLCRRGTNQLDWRAQLHRAQ